MADVYTLVAEQAFTAASTITVAHGAGSTISVQVIVDAEARADLIAELVVSTSDPLNVLTVVLTAAYSGVIQIFRAQAQCAAIPTPEESAVISASSLSGSDILVKAERMPQALESFSELTSATIGAIAVALPLDGTRGTATDITHPTKHELQFERDGVAFITGGIGVRQTAGLGRTIVDVWIEHQPHGGHYASVPGSHRWIYTRNSSDGHYGGVQTCCVLRAGRGDLIQLVGRRVSGTGTVVMQREAGSFAVMLLQ